jgi:hypothetical protein
MQKDNVEEPVSKEQAAYNTALARFRKLDAIHRRVEAKYRGHEISHDDFLQSMARRTSALSKLDDARRRLASGDSGKGAGIPHTIGIQNKKEDIAGVSGRHYEWPDHAAVPKYFDRLYKEHMADHEKKRGRVPSPIWDELYRSALSEAMDNAKSHRMDAERHRMGNLTHEAYASSLRSLMGSYHAFEKANNDLPEELRTNSKMGRPHEAPGISRELSEYYKSLDHARKAGENADVLREWADTGKVHESHRAAAMEHKENAEKMAQEAYGRLVSRLRGFSTKTEPVDPSHAQIGEAIDRLAAPLVAHRQADRRRFIEKMQHAIARQAYSAAVAHLEKYRGGKGLLKAVDNRGQFSFDFDAPSSNTPRPSGKSGAKPAGQIRPARRPKATSEGQLSFDLDSNPDPEFEQKHPRAMSGSSSGGQFVSKPSTPPAPSTKAPATGANEKPVEPKTGNVGQQVPPKQPSVAPKPIPAATHTETKPTPEVDKTPSPNNTSVESGQDNPKASMQSSMNALTDYFRSFLAKHARNVQQHEEWHDRFDDLPYPRMVTNFERNLSELGDAEKKFLADGDPREYLSKIAVLSRLYHGINQAQSKFKLDSQVQEDIPKPFDTPGISQRMRDYLSLSEAEHDAFDKLRAGEYKYQNDDKAFPKEKLDKLENMYNAIAEKLYDVRTDLGRELVNARGGVAYAAPAQQATSGPNAEQPSPPRQAPSSPVADQPKPSRGSSPSAPSQPASAKASEPDLVLNYFNRLLKTHTANVKRLSKQPPSVYLDEYRSAVLQLKYLLEDQIKLQPPDHSKWGYKQYRDYLGDLNRKYSSIKQAEEELPPNMAAENDPGSPADIPGISPELADYFATGDVFHRSWSKHAHRRIQHHGDAEMIKKIEDKFDADLDKARASDKRLSAALRKRRYSMPKSGQKPGTAASSAPQPQNADAHYIFVSREGKRAPVAGPYASNEDLEADFPRVLAEMGKKYPGSVGSLMSRAKVTDPAVREKIDTHIQRVFPAGARPWNREGNGGEASSVEKAFRPRRYHAQTMFDTSRANSVVPLSSIVPPPKDKRSTTKVLHRMLRAKYGMYPRRSPMVAHRLAGGRLRIVDGHAMYWAARKMGLWALPVRIVRSRGLRFRAKASARDRD